MAANIHFYLHLKITLAEQSCRTYYVGVIIFL